MVTSPSKSRNKPSAKKTSPAKKTKTKPKPQAKGSIASKLPLKKPRLKSRAERVKVVAEMIARLRAINPRPRCELYYRTPFQLLVSVVLSAQTTDKMVNQCMQPVYDEGGFDPDFVLELGASGLLKIIRRIGLAPTKSKRVVALAEILNESYGGKVPNNREALENLPGVGRKTANVILGELFGDPTIAVDTHVFRVSARLGLQNENTPEKCEQVLLDIIDKKYLPAAHHWFILHGRYTCKAINPACQECPLADICPSNPYPATSN